MEDLMATSPTSIGDCLVAFVMRIVCEMLANLNYLYIVREYVNADQKRESKNQPVGSMEGKLFRIGKLNYNALGYYFLNS
jgi:hypothetical protein